MTEITRSKAPLVSSRVCLFKFKGITKKILSENTKKRDEKMRPAEKSGQEFQCSGVVTPRYLFKNSPLLSKKELGKNELPSLEEISEKKISTAAIPQEETHLTVARDGGIRAKATKWNGKGNEMTRPLLGINDVELEVRGCHYWDINTQSYIDIHLPAPKIESKKMSKSPKVIKHKKRFGDVRVKTRDY